jgi:uncharacterized damage-inducible protein DinB
MEILVKVSAASPDDKWNWEPLENGRSIQDQMTECCMANTKWASILTTRIYANLNPEIREAIRSACATSAGTRAKLTDTANLLASAILAVPDNDLDQVIETEWGPYTVADCLGHAYWNMVYHEGQINYIQTLYGDFEEHVYIS